MRLMQSFEGIRAKGFVRMDILDAQDLSKILYTQYSHNLIVATGRIYLGLLLKGSEPAPTDVGVGVDATAAADGQTALLNQAFKSNITQRLDITNGLRIRYLLSSSSANGNTLTEAAILGPSPNLYMLSRVTHTGIVKSASVAVNYTWDITFTQP